MDAEAGGGHEPAVSVDVEVDGISIRVKAGETLLDACDAAGRYVPRLCVLAGSGCSAAKGRGGAACGLCVVRNEDGSTTLACSTLVGSGRRVITDDPGLRAMRREALATVLSRHPHVCLSCPDRHGCSRDECTYGNPPEARCCSEFGRCELGRLVEYVDPELGSPRRAVCVDRSAYQEGHIRREPGLCIGCGRCVRECATASQAGQVLELVPVGDPEEAGQPGGAIVPRRLVARPKLGTLRESGCTFCGLCVMVCPTGAITAPGEAGSRWLSERRMKASPPALVLPPQAHRRTIPGDLHEVPSAPGLFTLYDRAGQVLRISGVPDLRTGLETAVSEPSGKGAAFFAVEVDPFYTQRETECLARHLHEHGRLPLGNDLGEELFEEDDD